MLRLSHLAAAITGLMMLSLGTARAGTWDLNLSRLSLVQVERNGQIKRKSPSGQDLNYLDGGGGYDPTLHGHVLRVIPDNAAFRALMSEIGAVFAPNILQPSNTRGYGGFSFNAEFAWTQVNPKRLAVDPVVDCSQFNTDGTCVSQGPGTPFWRAAGSVSDEAFAKGNIRNSAAASEIRRLDRELPPDFAPTVTIMARKGLWFPVPSFELGVGVRHLLGSRMWAPVAQAKLAIHEGFQSWPIPAIAVRASGARVMGTTDFNLTVVGLDFSISKHFGVASTMNLTPYAGYQFLWIIADSEVVDATPAINPMQKSRKTLPNDPKRLNQCIAPDCNGYFAFADQGNITRHRGFFGIRANFFVATLMLEYSFFTSGAKSDEIYRASGANKLVPLTVPDSAGWQHTIALSVGLDF